ncbi:Uma2 family endonuclease [Leptolyngbya sp. DQ-M1]|uniref:Uma2 family endonuclease n=1 Tax=Leptolyngbya sp. DQ-M1 TaxID=2933920 RepID=UPI003299FB01
MTQAKRRFGTFEEYLNYDDGTDTRYELVNGELVAMAPENPLNVVIASFLFARFLEMGIPSYRLAIGHQIATRSTKVTARQPDLIVHTEESAAAILAGGNVLRPEMPPPLLVVEVVSSSDQQSRERDYVDKRKEYAERGISEYWLIDPAQSIITVLQLENDRYREVGKFKHTDTIVSPAFSTLQLTAEQTLKAGR